MNNIIKIGIAGNKSSSGGHQALIGIDYALEDLKKDFEFPFNIKSDYLIDFSQTANEIKYTYLANPNTVHSYGASRPGSFWLSMTLPKGKHIENYTPYTLLMKILGLFRELYMTRRTDGSYEFKDLPSYQKQPIEELLNGLTVSDNKGRHIVMNGDSAGYVSTGVGQMEQFFADPQYSEFSRYKHIVVAERIDGSTLPVLIPRPINYKVYYNNTRLGEITSESKKFSCPIDSADKYHDNVEVTVALSDKGVIASANCGIVVDESNERITVTPKFPVKEFKVGVKFDKPEGVDVEALGLYFPCGAETIALEKDEDEPQAYHFTFRGREIESVTAGIRCAWTREDLSIKSQTNGLGLPQTITITIAQKPRIESVELIGEIPELSHLTIYFKDGTLKDEPIEKGRLYSFAVGCLKEKFDKIELSSNNYTYNLNLKPSDSKCDKLIYEVTATSKQKLSTPAAFGYSKAWGNTGKSAAPDTQKQDAEGQTLTIKNRTEKSFDIIITAVTNEYEIRRRNSIYLEKSNIYIESNNDKKIQFPVKDISEVCIEFVNQQYKDVCKSVENSTVSLYEEDLSSGLFRKLFGFSSSSKNSAKASSKKKTTPPFKLMYAFISIIIFAVVGIVLCMTGIIDNPFVKDEFAYVKDIIKEFSELAPVRQSNHIHSLSNWDKIFECDSVASVSYERAKDSLDSLRQKYSESDKKIEEIKSLQNKLDEKNTNHTKEIDPLLQEQIDRFYRLLTKLQIDEENDEYKLRFDDVYLIPEWLDKVDTLKYRDLSRSENYQFVKKMNQYYVDYVRILVNNGLKTDLKNLDKYKSADSAKYKINVYKISSYPNNNPFRNLYNSVKTAGSEFADKIIYFTNNDKTQSTQWQRTAMQNYILTPLGSGNKSCNTFSKFNTFSDITRENIEKESK